MLSDIVGLSLLVAAVAAGEGEKLSVQFVVRHFVVVVDVMDG